jgi:hypothetical protein
MQLKGQHHCMTCVFLQEQWHAYSAHWVPYYSSAHWLPAGPAVALLQTQLQAHRFFGRPKLAFDAVGGDSAGRIAEVLEQVGFGCCLLQANPHEPTIGSLG